MIIVRRERGRVMRLIDADKLMKELEREVELADDWKTAHEIANCVKYTLTVEVAKDINVPDNWISVKDRLPPNADHPGSFCPRYHVMTKYGVTEGWYNPDKGCWYTLVWFYLGRKTFDDIDFERGDIPGITDKIEVTHWKEMPEPPDEDATSENH